MRTKYFKRSEFACKCGCGFDVVDFELLHVLTDVREHFGKPVTMTSGNRCIQHNSMTVGASSKSMHVKGMAADFKVEGVHADVVADYLEAKYPDRYGIARYLGRTHIDVRSNKARWDKR